MNAVTPTTKTPASSLYIRWMIRRDMPEVLAIEELCFEHLSWADEDFLRVLRQRNAIGMVVEQGEKIVGYMIYELHQVRLEVLNFAVHPNYARQGAGAAMVQKLIGKLTPQRRRYIGANVNESRR